MACGILSADRSVIRSVTVHESSRNLAKFTSPRSEARLSSVTMIDGCGTCRNLAKLTAPRNETSSSISSAQGGDRPPHLPFISDEQFVIKKENLKKIRCQKPNLCRNYVKLVSFCSLIRHFLPIKRDSFDENEKPVKIVLSGSEEQVTNDTSRDSTSYLLVCPPIRDFCFWS